MICNDYRAVTLIHKTYKILANILYVKLVPYAQEITEYQISFQRRNHLLIKFLLRDQYWKNVRIRTQTYITYLLILKQHLTLYAEMRYGMKDMN
jgi:hypothetical protein